MSPRRKSPEEEAKILESIEQVAQSLSTQVSELQKFIKELKESRHSSNVSITQREQVPPHG